MKKFLRSWIFYAGVSAILNAIFYAFFKQDLIEGTIWRVVFPLLMVPAFDFIDKMNKMPKRNIDSL